MAEARFADVAMKPLFLPRTTMPSCSLAPQHLRTPAPCTGKVFCSFSEPKQSAPNPEHGEPSRISSVAVGELSHADKRSGRGKHPPYRPADDAAPPVVLSSRGKTRQSLGLNDSASVNINGSSETVKISLEETVEVAAHDDASTSYNNINPTESTRSVASNQTAECSPESWIQASKPSKEASAKSQIADIQELRKKVQGANPEEFQKLVQDMINADLERKYNARKLDGDDEEYPLYVDEEDPYWLDEPDEGWGFRVSDFFKEDIEIKKTKKNVDDDDNGEMDWDLEPDTWCAREIDSMMWTKTVFDDPSPLVILVFERYGRTARECYHVLRELEDAANNIWKTNRLPPRLVKINASVEIDLASALHVKEHPTLFFIKAGKLLHRQSGYLTSDNLMRMMGYFYHGASRPPCLKIIQSSFESVPKTI